MRLHHGTPFSLIKKKKGRRRKKKKKKKSRDALLIPVTRLKSIEIKQTSQAVSFRVRIKKKKGRGEKREKYQYLRITFMLRRRLSIYKTITSFCNKFFSIDRYFHLNMKQNGRFDQMNYQLWTRQCQLHTVSSFSNAYPSSNKSAVVFCRNVYKTANMLIFD